MAQQIIGGGALLSPQQQNDTDAHARNHERARAKATIAATPHDALTLPDGRRLGEVMELSSVLLAHKIPGADATKGRLANAECYARHLESLKEQAGAAAVANYLAGAQRP